jgi:hypothetical protein
MKHDPDKVMHKVEQLGLDWADKKAAADEFEETKKSLLARIATNSGESSEAAKERYALASGEYEEHILNMVQAKREANRAKVKYDSAQVWCDFTRSIEATKRTEMKLI